MKTKKWLQTATVGLDKAKEKFPFTYHFTDSDETGLVTVFVDEKDNGEIDVYKLHAKSGFITKETDVSPEYIMEIEANVNDEPKTQKEGEEAEEISEETLTRDPPNSNSPKIETPYTGPMYV